jgi:hypothetical protein
MSQHGGQWKRRGRACWRKTRGLAITYRKGQDTDPSGRRIRANAVRDPRGAGGYVGRGSAEKTGSGQVQDEQPRWQEFGEFVVEEVHYCNAKRLAAL